MYSGHLKIWVLSELSKKSHSGYELINSIDNSLGKKPSPGSMYPLLNELHEHKLISLKEDGRKKIYSITAKGKKAIQGLLKEREEILFKHAHICEKIKHIDGKETVKNISSVTKRLLALDKPLMRNIDLLFRFKDTLVKVASSENFKDKEKELRKILQETIKKIEKLAGGK